MFEISKLMLYSMLDLEWPYFENCYSTCSIIFFPSYSRHPLIILPAITQGNEPNS